MTHATCLSLLAALCLAACGGEQEAETTVVTETTVASATTTSGQTTTVAQPALATPRFQLPSKNIGCVLEDDVLRCDILSGLSPEPEGACELDWVGLVLRAEGPTEPSCAGDTAYDEAAPTLAYGESWARNGLTCAAEQSGLTCTNEAGHSFTLARAGWTAS
jgi:hypothetical protein